MSKRMDMPKGSGYDAWLHYHRARLIEKMPAWCRVIVVHDTDDEVLQTAASELQQGLASMFGQQPKMSTVPVHVPFVALGTFQDHPCIAERFSAEEQAEVSAEGYRIRGVEAKQLADSTGQDHDDIKGQCVTVAGQNSKGVLYGVFHLLRYLQGGLDGKLKPTAKESLHAPSLDLLSNPANPIRMINHWDNMDGSVEPGSYVNPILPSILLHLSGCLRLHD